MFLIRYITIFLLQLSLLSYCYADDAINALNQALAGIHTMQANFTQTIVDNKGKVIQTAHGKMALLRPGQFRWETISPNQQLVIANGIRLWIYDPDLEQVIIRSLVKQTGETPALLLSDENPPFAKDFQIKMEQKTNMQWFVLVPKDPSSMFASIRMGFANGQIREMRLQDHLGHLTTIQFLQVKSNTNIPASLFHFVPPKHVDVIDETKQ